LWFKCGMRREWRECRRTGTLGIRVRAHAPSDRNDARMKIRRG
jgi:hypothetical protein